MDNSKPSNHSKSQHKSLRRLKEPVKVLDTASSSQMASHFFRFNSFLQKKPEPPKRPQEMRAKLGAKPFDSCQHHWTTMDTLCVAPALQLHEAASQGG
jgi:hypothetical protein